MMKMSRGPHNRNLVATVQLIRLLETQRPWAVAPGRAKQGRRALGGSKMRPSMGHTGRLYAQFWSMLLLFGVHMLRGTSICWSLFRAGRLDGYVAAVGSQLIHHGHFHPVIAALNLTFPLYKSDVIIYLYASSMISIINIPHFHLTSFVISTQCHLEVTTSH